MAALVRRVASRVVLSRSYPRLVLLVMASVLLLSGCMLSPLFQAPAAVMTGIAVLLGLAACSGGGGGGGGGGDNTVTHGNWPVIVDLSDLNPGQHGVLLTGSYGEGAGFSLASGRDVNGDGVHDLVIGAPYGYGAFENSQGGKAYVVFGQAGLTALAGANGSFGSRR